MTNYLNLAKLTKPDTIEFAGDIFKMSISAKDISKDTYKTQILDLNSFLYTYFLITYNKDLVLMHKDFNKKIESATTVKDLENLAKLIIKSYAETLLEKIKCCDNQIVDEAIRLVNSNFDNGINLENLAKILHVSKNYLCRLFKEKTGFTFCQYLNILKTNKAKELLKENKKTLEFIAFSCGFSSQPHFNITFKKYTGLTPKEYSLKNTSNVNC